MKLARGYISINKDGIDYISAESLRKCMANEDDKTNLETINKILSDPNKAIVPAQVWFEIEKSIVIEGK